MAWDEVLFEHCARHVAAQPHGPNRGGYGGWHPDTRLCAAQIASACSPG